MTVRELIWRLSNYNLDLQVTDQDHSSICSVVRGDSDVSLRSWNDVNKFAFVEAIALRSITSLENLSESDIKTNVMDHLDELGIYPSQSVVKHIDEYVHNKLAEKENINAEKRDQEIKRLKAQHDKLQKELVECMAKLIDLTNEKYGNKEVMKDDNSTID